MSAFRRHTRVWPTAAGYALLAQSARDAAALGALELWSARGWPLIVRRSANDEPRSDGTISAGLSLPPALGKKRFALRLPRAEVAAHALPLLLDEVIARLAPAVAHTLAPIARAAMHERIVLRVFGSASWQAETDLDYLRADSDLDLLMEPATRAELRSMVALAEGVQRSVTMRLDGEIVFPGGDAVAWREWAGAAADRVLVKSLARVALVPRDDLERALDRCLLAA